jgi:hypothetical protein
MRLKLETGLTVIIMAVIFTLALTGECSPAIIPGSAIPVSLFNVLRAAKSDLAGSYNKVGLATRYINHPMGILRWIP